VTERLSAWEVAVNESFVVTLIIVGVIVGLCWWATKAAGLFRR